MSHEKAFLEIRKIVRFRETALEPLSNEPMAPLIETKLKLPALGRCGWEIRHGVKDNLGEVYEIPESSLNEIEPDLIYPYLKSRHILAWGILGYSYRLIPQRKAGEINEIYLSKEYPRTYEYLDRMKKLIKSRRSRWLKTGPFYSVFGLGDYTWMPFKVTWCRLGFRPDFAVVSSVEDPKLGTKLLIPGDHFMFIPTKKEDDAHFLCGLLNSRPYRNTVMGLSHRSKTALSRGVIEQLYLPTDAPMRIKKEIWSVSKELHNVIAGHISAMNTHCRADYKEPEEAIRLRAKIDELVTEFLRT